MWDLVGNVEDRFSHNEARFSSEHCQFYSCSKIKVYYIYACYRNDDSFLIDLYYNIFGYD